MNVAAKRNPYAAIIKKLEASRAKIATERDKLRALLDDIEALHGSTQDAEEQLERCVDTLSEYA